MKHLSLYIFFIFTLFIRYSDAQTLPSDSNFHIGHLPNGLTFYLRNNEASKGYASFYFIQRTGSMQEEDSQNGLAHFLEHMAFNGSENFLGNHMMDYLSYYHTKYNAYTGREETIYCIDNAPMPDPKRVDSCLLMLYDFSNALSLADSSIEKERGVIIEEWRYGFNSKARLKEQTDSIEFAGTKFFKHDILGDTATIQHFSHDELRQFYKNWYRPDLQAIAIVGDFDINSMEKKIRTLFNRISTPTKEMSFQNYEIPFHKENRYVLATDPEAPFTTYTIKKYIPSFTPYISEKEKKISYMIALYADMINYRLEELCHSMTPPFTDANSGYYGQFVKNDLYESSFNVLSGREKEGLIALVKTLEQIRRFGFTKEELELSKLRCLSAFDETYNEKIKTNKYFIKQAINNFLNGNTILSSEDENKIIRRLLDSISIEDMHNWISPFLFPDNTTIEVCSPTGVSHLSKDEVLSIYENRDTLNISPYVYHSVDSAFFNYKITPGKIIKEKQLRKLNAKLWTLSNGAKVYYRHTSCDKNNITISAFSPGGKNQLPDSLLSTANFFNIYYDIGGLGHSTNLDLWRRNTGITAKASLSLLENFERASAECTRPDEETMFQLLWMRFCKPRFDTTEFKTYHERFLSNLERTDISPDQMENDTIRKHIYNNNPRLRFWNRATLQQLSYKQLTQIYTSRFSNAADFNFIIVGDIKEEELRPLIEKYIASLPSNDTKSEVFIDNNGHYPTGENLYHVTIPRKNEKANIYCIYANEKMPQSPRNELMLNTLMGIVRNRCMKTIRNKKSATYNILFQCTYSIEPYKEYSLLANFECEKDRAETLYPIINNTLRDIAANGVTQTEVYEVTPDLWINYISKKQHNDYWDNVLYRYALEGINMDASKNYEQIVKSISSKDIKKFCKKFLADSSRNDFIFSTSK